MSAAPMLNGYTAPDGQTYCAVNAAAVTAVHVDDAPPRDRTDAYGYGETGTRYAVTLSDRRRRRVYVRTYGNSGTLGVYVRGVFASLAPETEYALEDERDYADGTMRDGLRVRDRQTGATGTHRGMVRLHPNVHGHPGDYVPLVHWDGAPGPTPWTYAPEALELAR